MKKKLNPLFAFVMGAICVVIAAYLFWASYTSNAIKQKFSVGMYEAQVTVSSVERSGYGKGSHWIYYLQYNLPGKTTVLRLAHGDSATLFGRPDFTEGQVITVEVNPEYTVAYLPSAFAPSNRFGFLVITIVFCLPLFVGGVMMMALPFIVKKRKKGSK